MPPTKSFWYRVGFALERARPLSPEKRKLPGLRERVQAHRRDVRAREDKRAWPDTDQLVASGIATVAARVLGAWRPRKRGGVLRLLRAGAAGAGGALLVELVRPLLEGRWMMPSLDGELGERLLVGAGQGVVYGAAVEPLVPGSPLVKGTVYGTAEYMADPLGGLSRLLGSRTPLGRIPAIARLLEDLPPRDRSFVEHVTFAVALALLYGSSPSSNGILEEGGGEA